MIQLHHDYLLIRTSTGEAIPCSAELVAIELVGDSASNIDPEVVRQAAAAVLHYFKNDLKRETVSVAEFSSTLQRVLTALGVVVAPVDEPTVAARRPEAYDLTELAGGAGESLELAFFVRLRDQLRTRLTQSPRVLHFQGLRPCVKQLLGAKRWNGRCQELNDQIVGFLRQCLQSEARSSSCGLVVK